MAALEKLRERRAALDEQIRDAMAREQKKEKREENRRSMIIGQNMLARFRNDDGNFIKTKITVSLHDLVKGSTEKDHNLFNLPYITEVASDELSEEISAENA
jgi:hypothetical protein